MNAGRDDDDALWSAYLDDTLEPQARARADARLRTSVADREALEAMRLAEARLRATEVPDPGAAYWRDFGARVESRLQPTAEARPDPARIYEKLVGWLLYGGRVRWMRAAGALAGLTLVTYIGMRGFRPSEVRMRSTTSMESKPQHQDAREQGQTVRDLDPVEPETGIPPPAESQLRAESDEAQAKSEVEAPKSTEPPSAEVVIPKGPILRVQETRDKKKAEKFAREPQPETDAEQVSVPKKDRAHQVEEARRGEDRVDAPPLDPDNAAPQLGQERVGSSQAAPKQDDSRSLDVQVRGSQANDVTVPIPSSTLDKEMLALRDRTAYLVPRSVADSLASYLAMALRDDASRARERVATRSVQPGANQRRETALRAPSTPASKPELVPSPAPMPLPLATTAEVDRLLHLADLAQRYESDATFRPHLETVAIQLARYAREDARARARARTLMRKLADSSATAGERAAWEERLRELPL